MVRGIGGVSQTDRAAGILSRPALGAGERSCYPAVGFASPRRGGAIQRVARASMHDEVARVTAGMGGWRGNQWLALRRQT